jgi:hypothetical protein
MIGYLLNALLGVLLIRQLPANNRVGRLCGVYLFNSIGPTFPLILSLISSNVSGFTKKSTVNAMFFVAYCVGSIAGPQTYKSGEEKEGYPSAYVFMMVCLCVSILIAMTLRVMMQRENARRDREFGVVDPYAKKVGEYVVHVRELVEDLTDKESEKTFRYMY